MVVASDITPASAPRRRDDLTSVELDGETVLFRAADGTMHKLDAVGTLLWKAFDGKVSLTELAEEIGSVLEEDVDTITDDLLDYTRRLSALGLLVDTTAIDDHGRSSGV